MKIPIITLHFSINYGGALQAYAHCEAIRKVGHEPVLLDYCPAAYNLCYSPWKNWGLRSQLPLSRMYNRTLYALKYRKFKEFKRQYFPCSIKINSREELRAYVKANFDRIIVGSDQVWNTNYVIQRPECTYFLDFLKPEDGIRKFSFASCFGAKTQLPELESKLPHLLSEFEEVAVRNRFSAEMYTAYTGREAKVVSDPSALSDFSGLGNKRLLADDYLLVYGNNMEPTAELYERAKKVEGVNGIRILVLGGGRIKLRKQDVSKSYASPNDWVSAFKHARFLVTNSFHATQFAQKFKLPFVAYEDGELVHRLYSSLLEVGLADRLVGWQDPRSFNLDDVVDFSQSAKVMLSRYHESMAVLERYCS